MTNRSRVLHVLPHPGGGGERYVDLLRGLDGFDVERIFLGRAAVPRPDVLAAALRAQSASRRFDLLHVHGEIPGLLCLPALGLRPSVITLHGLSLVRRLEGRRRVAAELNLKLIARAASATVCVSDAELAEARATVGDASRLVLIRNGVEPSPLPTPEERAEARQALDIRQEVVVGLFVGVLEEHKGVALAAEATVALSSRGLSIVLLIAGEGRLRSGLEHLASQCEAIRVLGSRNDIPNLLAAADFFVLPSAHEGTSFALLEAMMLGVVPVVLDAPGNADVVGDAGVIVPNQNAEDLASALEDVARDQQRRVALGARARERVFAEFGAEEMRRATLDLYRSVLNESRDPR
jgi:glycosyltransferase involved in cell wall biosynthesis